MIARPGKWHEVHENGYVKDKQGRLWRVEKISPTEVRLLGRDYKPHTIDRPRDYQPVTIVEITVDEAIAAVQSVIDGTVISEEEVPA